MMIKHRPSRASLKAGTPKYMMPKSCASLLERAVSRWREPLQALPQEGLYLKPFFKPVSNLLHKLMQPRHRAAPFVEIAHARDHLDEAQDAGDAQEPEDLEDANDPLVADVASGRAYGVYALLDAKR